MPEHPPGPLCIICHRREDDPLHGQAELGGLAHENVPTRFPQHAFDPGERRQGTRREKDRQDEAWDKARDERDADDWNREHRKTDG